jgi:hypothetical protein
MRNIDDPELRQALSTFDFWRAYYWNDSFSGDPLWDPRVGLDDDADELHVPRLKDYESLFGVTDLCVGHSTSLLMTFYPWTTLMLRDDALIEPMEIARLGPHEIPILFRWPETRVIAKSVEKNTWTVTRGSMLLLLAIFTPLTADDDPELVRCELRESWDQLGVFSDDQIAYVTDCVAYGESFRWQKRDGKWMPDEDVYTFRDSRVDYFPWSAFDRLVRQC